MSGALSSMDKEGDTHAILVQDFSFYVEPLIILFCFSFQANIGQMDTSKELWRMITGNMALIQVSFEKNWQCHHKDVGSGRRPKCPSLSSHSFFTTSVASPKHTLSNLLPNTLVPDWKKILLKLSFSFWPCKKPVRICSNSKQERKFSDWIYRSRNAVPNNLYQL